MTKVIKAAGLPDALSSAPTQDASQGSDTSIRVVWTVPGLNGGEFLVFSCFLVVFADI